MYFDNRAQAGQQIASILEAKYRYEDVAVLALSAGGVSVGYEIAIRLHARLSMLLTEQIVLPAVSPSHSEVMGLIDQEGHFTRNPMMPTGLIDMMESEMRTYLDAQKMDKLHRLSRAVDAYGSLDPQQFYGYHVIIVSDGFKNGLAFEAAANYLKPVNTGKLIAVAPNASVSAIDRLHVTADDLAILDVLSNYLDTDHYFEDNTIPDVQVLMNDVIRNWL